MTDRGGDHPPWNVDMTMAPTMTVGQSNPMLPGDAVRVGCLVRQ
jgi:hypothetical protein